MEQQYLDQSQALAWLIEREPTLNLKTLQNYWQGTSQNPPLHTVVTQHHAKRPTKGVTLTELQSWLTALKAARSQPRRGRQVAK